MPPQLPVLREELALLPGAPLADGQPSWTLHDPGRNLFFQIDWPSFEILQRWGMPPEAIVADIARHTTLDVDMADIERIARFILENELAAPSPGTAPRLAGQWEARRGSWAKWLLHNYLFMRIPLVKPDRWLTRALPYVAFFHSQLFIRLTLLVGALGLIGVYREWGRFSGSLVDMLTWDGLLAYGITLTGVHVVHELGHAFTAKRFGCRVPSMGVALLVMWPVAYTDTNEVWKLTRRREKLAVASAGIIVELMMAAWATFFWLWLPEGGLKSAAFLIATTTWISTLVINASPFMRFDGYFILSDALQLPNLHTRAFNLARWDLRERLFRLGEAPPEHFPALRHNALIALAWATWIYRLVLFLGIAAMVYHYFFKLLGIFLFSVEIGWFVMLPLWTEIRAWRDFWPRIAASRRARRSGLALLALLLLFVLPWPSRVTTTGVLHPRNDSALYAPPHAQLVALPVADRQHVAADTLLVDMRSPDLAARQNQGTARIEQLSWSSSVAGLDPEQRRGWGILHAQLANAAAERQGADTEALRYQPRSPFAGVFRDLDPDLAVGDWLGGKEALGRVVGDGPQQVIAYVDDGDIQRIAVGNRALFVANGGAGPTVRLEVADIGRDASRQLNEPELASLFGGNIQAREKNGVFYPERAIYRVTFDVLSDMPSSQHRWRGQTTIAGSWEAPGMRYLRQAATVWRQEVGF